MMNLFPVDYGVIEVVNRDLQFPILTQYVKYIPKIHLGTPTKDAL
jgi:hypothetical protein